MQLSHNRVMSVLATTVAVLALGSAPALAGENDDGDDDEAAAQTAPAPATSAGQSTSGSVSGAPEGGVATGAGGMAPQGPGIVLLGLASGALVLMATGGGLITVARRGES